MKTKKSLRIILTIICFVLFAGFGKYIFNSENETVEVAISERPVFLYKILSIENWDKSSEEVYLSSMDADFIHLSTEEQLNGIIAKYWSRGSEYVVLKIETAKLPGKLVLEANPGGTNKYYHLYQGSIPLDSVVEVQTKRSE